MRTKAEPEYIQKLKQAISDTDTINIHDPNCIFYNEGKVCNMCLMMNKSCISVPPMLCKNMRKAWEIGHNSNISLGDKND